MSSTDTVNPNGPARPSHFNEDVNEYIPRDNTDLDYTGVQDGVPFAATGFEPPSTPAPVYLTESPPKDRTLRKWSATHVFVDTAAKKVQVAAANRNRTRLVVTNSDDTASVALVADENDNITIAGFWLGPGDTVEMFHNSGVWAQAIGGDGAANVEVLQEFDVDDV